VNEFKRGISYQKYEKYLDSDFLKILYYTVRLKLGDTVEKMHEILGDS
jgi:hypothetical protein